MAKVGVIGAGAWGIALAVLLRNNGNNVTVMSFVKKEVDMLKSSRENEVTLPGVKLQEDIYVTDKLGEAVEGMDIIVMSVASRFTRETASKLKNII
ncbi:MAG: NAD(P)-binding domain-containing protein, partial [Lachnospiraceae bacterium]